MEGRSRASHSRALSVHRFRWVFQILFLLLFLALLTMTVWPLGTVFLGGFLLSDPLMTINSLAQGMVEGYTAINSGDNTTRDARQTMIQVRLIETAVGETRVELVVSVQTEGDFPGGVSEQAMREHSLYELYFAALQQVLTERSAPKAVEKP